MKFSTSAVLALIGSYPAVSSAFVPQHGTFGAVKSGSSITTTTSTQVGMVLEMPKKEISKLEKLKVTSDHLIHPLLEVRHVMSGCSPSLM